MPSRDYLIVVDGELSDDVARAFEGMRLRVGDGTTTIQGPIRDQTELHGMLQRISQLGLELLIVVAGNPSGSLPRDDRDDAPIAGKGRDQ